MKVGITTFVTDEGIRPDVLGRALEERGFESLFVPEHSHIPASRQTAYPGGGELPREYYRTVDPFVSLSAAAAVTSRLRLAAGILLLPQRDTIQTAKEIASLDYISGGRFIFGAGAGWNREEMRNHGTDPRTRGAKMNEQLEAIKAILSGDKAEYHGRYVDFEPVYAWPKPAKLPPVYIGGNSAAAAARAVSHGDAWAPNGVSDPAEVSGQLRMLSDHGGQDVPVSVGVRASCGLLDAYAAAGAERAVLYLATMSESDTLRKLDSLSELVQRYGARWSSGPTAG